MLITNHTNPYPNTRSEVYEQIDIAPTLSVLLGTPIPASSIGSLIPELLAQLPVDEQLYALHYNARRLVHKVDAELGRDRLELREFYLQYREATELHKQYLQLSRPADDRSQYRVLVKRASMLYVSATRKMSTHLATNYVNYDYFYISLGLGWTTVVSIYIQTLTIVWFTDLPQLIRAFFRRLSLYCC